MFFDHIADSIQEKQLFGLESMWCINIQGLVRVPFFDSREPQYGYVVYYSEIKQLYGIVKFHVETGEIIWTSSVCNGGYGTPIVYNKILVCHKEFNSVVALDKENGAKVWEIRTPGRIRTSMSSYDGFCYFATSGMVYKINQVGDIVNTCICDGVFFYGNIIKNGLNLLVLGVEYDTEIRKSMLALFYFDNKLCLSHKIKLDYSPVVSADTSGFLCIDTFALVLCYDTLFKIDINNHSIQFKKKLEGIAGRHIPISDEDAIYYTTLNGYISSRSLLNGEKIWSRKMNECSIVAPPSLKGRSLFVIADGLLNVLDKENGNIIQTKVIGHSPYSASILFDNKVFIGGGEPPVYGTLLCFKISPYNDCQNDFFTVSVIDENVSTINKTIYISTTRRCRNITINPSAIAIESQVRAESIDGTLFKLSFRLKNNCIKGYYGIPIQLILEEHGEVINTMFRLELQSLKNLPPKVLLEHLASPIKQESDLLSGAAIAKLLLAQYGRIIDQKEFRKFIDYIKDKSHWKDADFQTWRLILRRVLSIPYNTLNEFIKKE